MARYVFSLGLIPVQEWISEARRSRDLGAGSVFLCHVMARVLARLERDAGAEVRIPVPPPGKSFQVLARESFSYALEWKYGIPNRASGTCEGEERKVRRAFESLQAGVVDAEWEDLKRYLSGSGRMEEERFWNGLEEWLRSYREATRRGSDCPLSLVWVVKPASGGEERLGEELQEIDRFYAEVKRARPVRPWRHGARVGKCNQCGRREAIGPRESFEAWRDWWQQVGQIGWVEEGRRLGTGERLCYVCLTKRMAAYAGVSRRRFPSTSEVAARTWIERCKERDRELAEGFLALERTAAAKEDFGAVLRLSDDKLREELTGVPDLKAALELRRQIRERIRAVNKAGAEASRPEPPLPEDSPSYLALLTFDGDSMGRKVREELAGMPRKLAAFAEEARRIAEARSATIFYLAGDEGLAMVAAEPALDLAFALREKFGEVFSGSGAPTLSMGLAFFEHGRPLSGAIRAARDVLRAAKEREDKNALGVAVETASGSRWSFVEGWGEAWERIRRAVRMVQSGKLSAGWAYDVESFVRSMPSEAWRRGGFADAAREEVRRLFFRRLAAEGRTAEERRADRESAWTRLGGAGWWPPDPRGGPVAADPDQFHLIGFLGRQAALAPVEPAA